MTYILGRVKHDDGTLTDKDTLSWSGYNMWKTNKPEYRRRYYECEKAFESVATLYGKQIHKQFEDDPNVKGSETAINVNLGGLKLLGYIDSLDPDTLVIIDFKTGREPWTNLKVHKHGQLVFYSLLVKLKYGKFNPKCQLHWHETRFKNKSMEFDGHILETESRELELTGKIEKFTRKIEKWEIDKLKEDIIKTALEIHLDYENYRIQNKI